MCTVVVSLEPAASAPLLLAGIRDEFVARPWLPPARHWPGSPLVGGRDEQAGGTWLAVHPDIPRVCCVLNGRGEPAPPLTRRSRGELPLRGAEQGRTALVTSHDDAETLTRYDPFHLIYADMTEIVVLSWDGRDAVLTALGPGTHVITNAGLDDDDPKVGYFGPRFAAGRPAGDPAASIPRAWGPWLPLLDEETLPATDPRAIRVRRELPDGRVWGTTSISLLALTRAGIRYDFQSVPGEFTPVDISR
jgi:Transport and Golgi organisation 2